MKKSIIATLALACVSVINTNISKAEHAPPAISASSEWIKGFDAGIGGSVEIRSATPPHQA